MWMQFPRGGDRLIDGISGQLAMLWLVLPANVHHHEWWTYLRPNMGCPFHHDQFVFIRCCVKACAWFFVSLLHCNLHMFDDFCWHILQSNPHPKNIDAPNAESRTDSMFLSWLACRTRIYRQDQQSHFQLALPFAGYNSYLGGGFTHVLCSPRSFGKWSNLTIFFKGWNHQLAIS